MIDDYTDKKFCNFFNLGSAWFGYFKPIIFNLCLFLKIGIGAGLGLAAGAIIGAAIASEEHHHHHNR